MNEETMLEKALKSTWEMDERFYQANKGLTMQQIVEKIEGRKFNFIPKHREPLIPLKLINNED
jgi:hypothetical protein